MDMKEILNYESQRGIGNMGSNILGIALIILAVVIIGIYMKVRTSVRKFSKEMFGTEDIVEGIKREELLAENTPKSAMGMTRLMLPLIEKDFPGFNWAQFRSEAESILREYLLCISKGEVMHDEMASRTLGDQVEQRIRELSLNKEKEYFDDIKIHQTEIKNYKKSDGICLIEIHTSVQYHHYIMSDGEIVSGSKTHMVQTRYLIELQYIQDEILASGEEEAIGLTCSQCGGPIKNLGAKYCEYCGSAIRVVDLMVWKFHKIYED